MSTTLPTGRSRGFLLAAYGTAFHAVLLSVVLAYSQFRVPAAQRTFDEFGMSLALLGLKVIGLSAWIAEHMPTFAPFLPLLPVAGFGLALGLGRCCLSIQKVWVYGVALVLIVAVAAHLVGIELPLMKLRDAVVK